MMTPSRMPTTITMMLNGCSDDGEAVKQIGDLFHLIRLRYVQRLLTRFAGVRDPSNSSIGPFGSGTRNHCSKTMKMTSGTPIAIGGDHAPAIFAEPAHEEGDQQHRGDIDAENGISAT